VCQSGAPEGPTRFRGRDAVGAHLAVDDRPDLPRDHAGHGGRCVLGQGDVERAQPLLRGAVPERDGGHQHLVGAGDLAPLLAVVVGLDLDVAVGVPVQQVHAPAAHLAVGLADVDADADPLPRCDAATRQGDLHVDLAATEEPHAAGP
jgi:hypothetical protein